MLVVNLAMVGDRVVRGHPAIPAGTYAIAEMGRKTAHAEVKWRDGVIMFGPEGGAESVQVAEDSWHPSAGGNLRLLRRRRCALREGHSSWRQERQGGRDHVLGRSHVHVD